MTEIEELRRALDEQTRINAAWGETYARYQRKLGAARAALREAIAVVEGRPDRSPFVAVEDWKKALEHDGKAERPDYYCQAMDGDTKCDLAKGHEGQHYKFLASPPHSKKWD